MESATALKDVLLGQRDGSKVTVRGWVQNKRSSGGIIFLLLRDGSGVVQCTLRKGAVNDSTFEQILSAKIESTVRLEGLVRTDPRAPGGREVQVQGGMVESLALEDFPIAKQFHGPDFLLDQRHLFIRTDKMRAMLKIRASILSTTRSWFDSHGYTEVQVPTLTSAAVEGGSTLFEVKYFDEKAYLTQSWQLYAEAMIASVGKIYTVAPSFRAERSRTRRHLTEYWHIEAEAPWCDLNGIIQVEEQLLSEIVGHLIRHCSAELSLFERKLEDLERVKTPFPRITYDEALEKIGGEKSGVKWGDDLGYEQEKLLTEHFDRPFFVTGYPKKAKAFYHKPDPARPDTTLSVDMLAPEGYGEITGGGQRIEEYDALIKRMNEEGLDPKSYSWYLDLRKFGSVPHSGFGMGLERVVSWICKLDHIRDAIAFPRLINRAYP
ncbi:MAG TPA: asparagine--tRNA ligase [Candidatus Bathyarchaeia archaeon]|nr:asparagine--tRNA ligase [Candidatus Bathyarchaeia archaeon]